MWEEQPVKTETKITVCLSLLHIIGSPALFSGGVKQPKVGCLVFFLTCKSPSVLCHILCQIQLQLSLTVPDANTTHLGSVPIFFLKHMSLILLHAFPSCAFSPGGPYLATTLLPHIKQYSL